MLELLPDLLQQRSGGVIWFCLWMWGGGLFGVSHPNAHSKTRQARCLRCLDALDQAESLTELSIPGFDFHGLQGVPKRYSIYVNGPWRITFEWENGEASRVDFEQYH